MKLKISWNKPQKSLVATFFMELSVAWFVVTFVNRTADIFGTIQSIIGIVMSLAIALLLLN